MTKADRFARLNGIELGHVVVNGIKHRETFYDPTFTDAKSILEVMEKRDDFGDFLIQRVGKKVIESNKIYEYVEIYYVYNPDKLLDEAIEWCISHKEDL